MPAAALAVLLLLPIAVSFSPPALLPAPRLALGAARLPATAYPSRRARGRGPLAALQRPGAPADERGEKGGEGSGEALRRAGAERAPAPARRRALAALLAAGALASGGAAAQAAGGALTQVSDPSTYPALAYAPPGGAGRPPLVLVLHGAGVNERDVSVLADPKGEHAGLIPSLLAAGTAPSELAGGFAVLAPYAQGRRSFYEEPRGKLLQFLEWAKSDAGRQAGCPEFDSARVFLFGFSDGATVGVELMTTGRFAGGVFAAYGFTGELPALALKRLKDVPIWVFHSADDVIFPISCSDKLVKSLRRVGTKGVVRYTRFDEDQEGFTGSVRGHSTGITASKDPEIYKWMMTLGR